LLALLVTVDNRLGDGEGRPLPGELLIRVGSDTGLGAGEVGGPKYGMGGLKTGGFDGGLGVSGDETLGSEGRLGGASKWNIGAEETGGLETTGAGGRNGKGVLGTRDREELFSASLVASTKAASSSSVKSSSNGPPEFISIQASMLPSIQKSSKPLLPSSNLLQKPAQPDNQSPYLGQMKDRLTNGRSAPVRRNVG
jgi:hypothetical protein